MPQKAVTRVTEGRYALVIVNSGFSDCSLASHHYASPNNDTFKLAEVLKDPSIGSFETKILVDESSHILSQEIEGFFSDRGCDDVLLLYYAGTGIKDEKDTYLASIDTNLVRLRSTSLPSFFIRIVMDNSISKRKILILDCMINGFSPLRELIPLYGKELHVEDDFRGFGREIMCSNILPSTIDNNRTNNGEVASTFTDTLVHALSTREADLDRDGRISSKELYHYISDRLMKETPKQKPTRWTFEERSELIIAQNPNHVLHENKQLTKKSENDYLLELLTLGKVADFNKTRKKNELISLDFSGQALHSVDLSGINFRGANLLKVDMQDTLLTGANLNEANLAGAILTGANLNEANLAGANLKGVDLTGASLRNADLSGSSRRTNITEASIIKADLSAARLSLTDFTKSNLTEALLVDSVLTEAVFYKCDLTGANLTNAKLINADLMYAKLDGSILTRALLTGANLSGAALFNADLSYADLSYADLSNTSLQFANLEGSKMNSIHISNATSFQASNLKDADFTDAVIENQEIVTYLRHRNAMNVPNVITDRDKIKKKKEGITSKPSSFDAILDDTEKNLKIIDDTAKLLGALANVDSAIDLLKKEDKTVKKITADMLDHLDTNDLRLIKAFESSMQNNYEVWKGLKNVRALIFDPITKAQTDQKLKEIAMNLCNDLRSIIDYLKQIGKGSSDKYDSIAHICDQIEQNYYKK